MNRQMKTATMMLLTFLPGLSARAELNLNSLVCRSYDYYQLGGDRKTLEVALTKLANGKFKVVVAHTFDTLQPDHQYLERNRYSDPEMPNLNCVQAPDSVDPKVITCTGDDLNSYFNISRLERTIILSQLSSRPGQVVKTISYEADVYGSRKNEIKELDPENCVLK
ncbi:MAG: hypothetical protein ACXVB9_19045 [Bdellovibrionota bacterium]